MSIPTPSTPRDWAAFLVDWRRYLFLLACVITVCSWGPASHLPADQSVEALFAKHDPRAITFDRCKALFGGDELAFFCYSDPDLNSPAGMSRLRDLSQELGEVLGVRTESVQDLATSLDQARLPFVNIPPDKFRELTHRVLLGDDGITTAIVIRFAPLRAHDVATGDMLQEVTLTTVPRAQTIRQIREIAAAHTRRTGCETHLVGEPVQELEALEYVHRDDLWLWIGTLTLLLVLLAVWFRSWRWTLAPVLVALTTVIWTRAILTLWGVHLGMISSMLNPLLTVISVALAIPIAVNFGRRQSIVNLQSANPRTNLEGTLRELTPILCATAGIVAIACSSLLVSEIYPLAEFGGLIALGALLTLPAIACVLPAAILWRTQPSGESNVPAETAFDRFLNRWSRFPERIPFLAAFVVLGVGGICLVGCTRLQVETDFIKNFRPSSPVGIGLDFVERHFGGSATWEVNFPTPDEVTEEFLARVELLARDLRQLQIHGRPALTKVICLADGEAIVPRTFFTSDLSRRLWLLDKLQAEYVSTLYNADARRMRLILRSLERQTSREKLDTIREVTEATRRHFPEAQATGIFVLLTFLIENLLRDQWTTLIVAAVSVLIAISLMFDSVAWGAITLAANILPLLLILGTLGWLGIPINIATGMVACISLGLTVISSIHFLSGYRRARSQGLAVHDALQGAIRDSGGVVVMVNLTLVCGLLVLTISHFIPVIYFGLLTSIVLLGGLLGNLCMLPCLLRWTERKKSPPDLLSAV